MFLTDGYQTLITLTVNPTILLAEVSVTPFGLEGGDEIDITTMRNVLMKTKAPQYLIEATNGAMVVAYDPSIYPGLINTVINVNTLVTVTHSDGSGLQTWGYMRNFIPNENTIGERPTANVVLVATCRDDNGTEVAPVHLLA